jgi:phosphoserine phosphatase RsbU/P
MFRRLTLIAKLSLLFFAFTLLNIVLIWFATGSNQMRLIAEKASLEMHRRITSVEKNLNQFLSENPAHRNAEFYASSGTSDALLPLLKKSKDAETRDLIEFRVVSDANRVYLTWPAQKTTAELTPEDTQNIIKTLRLREFNSETFSTYPDVIGYKLTVYIPFLTTAGQELLLSVVYNMDSMRTELFRLVRAGGAIVVLLLLVQILMGYFLYRLIVRPLTKLRVASRITGKGEFYQLEGFEKRQDEIGTLISSFNTMSRDIRDQKETIRQNFEEIRSRDEIMQHELMIAQHIQNSIIPTDGFPHELILEYRPLYAVSGDFYDVYTLPDGSTGYLLCDASGHGVPAALLTMMAKSAFSNITQRLSDPGEIVGAVNQHLAESLSMTGQYLTAIFVRVTGDRLEYCNATHPDAILVPPDGAEVIRLKSNGFYVGMLSDPPFSFETAAVPLVAGTRLILYTDGISEARNPEDKMWGVDALIEVVAANRNQNIRDAHASVLKALASYADGAPAEDDVTLISLEF